MFFSFILHKTCKFVCDVSADTEAGLWAEGIFCELSKLAVAYRVNSTFTFYKNIILFDLTI